MIDPKLQAELRAKFNPDGSELRKHQLRMLEMLKFIDKICRENDIKYWLSSGTCLGAVRHGGFIPWDDDVDIEMERSEYKKLVKILESTKSDKYILQSTKNDDTYVHTYVKLRDLHSVIIEPGAEDQKFHGCFIDIFPLERNNRNGMYITGELQNKFYTFLNQSSLSKKNKIFLTKIIRTILQKIYYPIIRFLNLPFTDNKKLHHGYGMSFYKPRYIQDIYPLKKITFEDSLFSVPGDTDHYLNTIYGNYNEIPAIKDLQQHTTNIKIYS